MEQQQHATSASHRTHLSRHDDLRSLEAMGNRLRIDSVLATSEAGSGHPSSCMSAADLTAAVFFHAMHFDVSQPHHPCNDRFILSKGHAAPLLYAAWAAAGAFPAERLQTLRQFGSDLEGHPTPRLPWVDVATGSLGVGLSNGVGMALNSKYLDRSNYRVYVLLGDGEIAEGANWEAAEIAAYYRLNNLIGLLDVNGLGQSQRTLYGHDSGVYRRRFEAFGWNALCIDGHDMNQIVAALDEAIYSQDRPTMIVASTRKGKGVTFIEDKDGWHGKALKQGEELERALTELHSNDLDTRGMAMHPLNGRTLAESAQAACFSSATPAVADAPYHLGDKVATRAAYGAALAELGSRNPLVVALDGDVKNSTFADHFARAYPQRYFEAFIAEQNMVGAAAGLAAMGKIPFVSTFASFLTRSYDQIRMAAISQANLKLCGSHAGVSIGEDGPSQMGLEDLAMLRAIQGSTVLYPSDAVATRQAVNLAAEHAGMVYIRTSRPEAAVIYGPEESFGIGQAKLLRHSDNDRLTIIAAGVTLFEALRAYDELRADGITVRIVDLFSVKPLDQALLRRCANEAGMLFITVEDHAAAGGIGEAVALTVAAWGGQVHSLAVHEMPRSGKQQALLAAYGIDADAIVRLARSLTAE